MSFNAEHSKILIAHGDGGNIAGNGGEANVSVVAGADEELWFLRAWCTACNPDISPGPMQIEVEVGSSITITQQGTALTGRANHWEIACPPRTFLRVPATETLNLILRNNQPTTNDDLQVTRLNLMYLARKVVDYS